MIVRKKEKDMELLLLILVCILLFGADVTKGCLFGVIKLVAFAALLFAVVAMIYVSNYA